MVSRVGFGLLMVALLLVGAPQRLCAIEFRGGQEVTVAAGVVIEDDLYVTGETVIIDGVVRGDIVAIGRHVVLNGAALGDFIAAGQGVVVNGQVADDVRIAGFGLRLGDAAAIGDDVIGAGFSLEGTRESLVAGSIVFSGFQALLAGEVRERLLGQMAALRIDGLLIGGGEVAVEADESAPPFMQLIPSPVVIPAVPAGLTVGPEARIDSDLVYTSPATAIVDPGGEAMLTHVEVARDPVSEASLAEKAAHRLWRFVSVFVAGLIVLLLAPGWLRRRAEFVGSRPLVASGWGIVGIVGWPMLALIATVLAVLLLILLAYLHLPALTMSVIALTALLIACTIGGLLASVVLLAPAVICMWLGRLLLRSPTVNPYLALTLGWVVASVVFVIPMLGSLAKLVAVVAGLGSIVAWVLARLTGRISASG